MDTATLQALKAIGQVGRSRPSGAGENACLFRFRDLLISPELHRSCARQRLSQRLKDRGAPHARSLQHQQLEIVRQDFLRMDHIAGVPADLLHKPAHAVLRNEIGLRDRAAVLAGANRNSMEPKNLLLPAASYRAARHGSAPSAASFPAPSARWHDCSAARRDS